MRLSVNASSVHLVPKVSHQAGSLCLVGVILKQSLNDGLGYVIRNISRRGDKNKKRPVRTARNVRHTPTTYCTLLEKNQVHYRTALSGLHTNATQHGAVGLTHREHA